MLVTYVTAVRIVLNFSEKQDVNIPPSVTEFGVRLYDANKKTIINIPCASLKTSNEPTAAKEILKGYSLLLFKKTPEMKDDTVPFFVKKSLTDTWSVEKNSQTSEW